MTPLHGRSPKGARLVASAPHGHWRTSTFLAGLRYDRLTAPAVFDGAINGELFTAYVEQVLAPTLSRGDIVVLDNLSSHKVRGVRELVEARGASLMFLPPYSPDLNPIEQVLPSSNSSSEKPDRDLAMRSGAGSEPSPRSSPHANARTTSPTPAIHGQSDSALEGRG